MCFLIAFKLLGNQDEIQFGWLLPNNEKIVSKNENLTHLPEEGLNLYNKPNGEYVGRLSRDHKSKSYPYYLRNVFLAPRDRAPELLVQEMFKPLPYNCYAIPFVKQTDDFILLFDTVGPYHYWASVSEIKSKNYHLTNKEDSFEPSSQASAGIAGILIPDREKLADLPYERYAYAPLNVGWAVYRHPTQTVWGNLTRFCPNAKYEDIAMRMFLIEENSNDCQHVTIEDLYHLSDETYVIPYFERENGYVRIFNEDKFSQIWVKESDITSQHFKIVDWISYFIESRHLPSHAIGDQSLRQGPYADAPVLTTVKGEEMEIVLIGYDDGYCEGNWCKVKVIVYKENPCTTTLPQKTNRINEYEGWMNFIDQSGLPTIYINTKGC